MAKTKTKAVRRTKAQAEKAEAQGGVMDQIAELCEALKKEKTLADEAEAKRKEHNKKVMDLGAQLVELADNADLSPPFQLKSGGKVIIKEDLSVKTEDQEALLHWLEANGEGDVIKSSVHAQTLKALCKRFEADHKPYPDGVAVSSYKVAQFRAK